MSQELNFNHSLYCSHKEQEHSVPTEHNGSKSTHYLKHRNHKNQEMVYLRTIIYDSLMWLRGTHPVLVYMWPITARTRCGNRLEMKYEL